MRIDWPFNQAMAADSRECMDRIEREDVRRRQLIEATIDTLAEVGFAATTLALIGQRARVSPGLIAHYFDDKDGLLEATLRSLAVAAGARRVDAASRGAHPARARPGGHRRDARAGGIRAAHVQRLARLLGPGDPFGAAASASRTSTRGACSPISAMR